jgi:hypothetical protein
MGTSNPFKGGNNRNPLIPDWVGRDGDEPAGLGGPGDGQRNPDSGDADASEAPAPNRFQSARTNFFKLAKTGGENAVGDGRGDGGRGGGGGGNARRNMRRAVGSFVTKASGGAHQAAQRMASERDATAALGRILSSAAGVGIQEAVRRLDLGQLAGLPVPDIYAALVDIVCQPGGELDEAFAREAYIQALAQITTLRVDLERPSLETIASFLASFITNAIQNRILNAVGNKLVTLPPDVAAVQNVEQQINDYIRGSVDDAMAEAGPGFPIDQIVETIDDIYERSLTLLDDEDGGEAPEEAA